MISVVILVRAPWLSQLIGSGGMSLPWMSFCSWSIHFPSLEASQQAMNLAWIVDMAMRLCFRDCHDIAQLLARNTLPLWDLRSALSLAQAQYEYPMILLPISILTPMPMLMLMLMPMPLPLKRSWNSAYDLEYSRTLLAAVIWLVSGCEFQRERTATVYEISGRIASTAYIGDPTTTR